MIYFGNPVTELIRDAIRAGHIGIIATPASERKSQWVDAPWCADNGCFTNVKFDVEEWHSWLWENVERKDLCVFATAPDVVGDAAATLERSLPWLDKIRQVGYPAAFVAQDGIEDTDVPWSEFDCLFLGGTTEFKLGSIAQEYAGRAKARGKWLHMGRVNSLKRLRYAEYLDCDSADGTHLTFRPDKYLGDVLHWMRTVHTEMPLELEW